MRLFILSLVLLVLTTISTTNALGQKASVTTAPADGTAAPTSDVEDLIARLHALEAENELLRAQLSSLAQNAPASASKPAIPEKPVAGMEGLMQGFPKEQMPTVQDDRSSLRYSLLLKWVRDHAVGKTITLHGRFGDADALSGDTFVARFGSGPVTQHMHPFVATVVLPASQAGKVLPLHIGDSIDITAHIQNADVLRVNSLWVVFFELDAGNIDAVGKTK
jgi:hypothetical protein